MTESLKSPSIAFISTMISVNWGGSEELWGRTAIKLANQGIKVFVNVKQWDPPSAKLEELRSSGCIVEERFFYRPVPWLNKVLNKFQPSRYHFASMYDPGEYLERVRPNLVVICQGSNQDGLEWMEKCRSKNIPYASISQAASESLWPDDSLAERMANCFHGSLQNYFVSKRNLELTVKQIGGNITNGVVVRNPFNVQYENDVSWKLSNTEYSLACIGRLHPYSKGQDLLFEVMRLQKWRERPLRVTLYGNGPNKNSLLRLKEFWKLDNVEFGGFVSNLEAIWQNHHGLILPSRYEGLPLAVVEAMLSKRMCIVTDVAGNNELIQDNVNGFMAEAPTAELLDEAMERAWGRREEWKIIGEQAHRDIVKIVPKDPVQVFSEMIKRILN